MNFLHEPPQPAYPAGYLTARVRGRRTRLIRNWQPYLIRSAPLPVATDAEIWEIFLAEARWLYSQMNPNLREIFRPVFGFFELHTLMQALRFIAAQEQEKATDILAHTLLHETIRNKLLGGKNLRAILPPLISQLTAPSVEKEKNITAIYDKEGLRGVEQYFALTYLEKVRREKRHPHVAFFFGALIDLRNTLSLAKQRRWKLDNLPELLTDGNTPVRQLTRRFLAKERIAAEDVSKVENTMYQTLTRRLQQLARQPDSVALLLQHLWQHYIQARNLGVLLHGKGMDQGLATGELIQ